PPEALALTRDGKLLISGAADKTIRIWELAGLNGGAVSSEPKGKEKSDDVAKPKTGTAKPDFTMKADQLAAEFKKDDAAATKKYKGKVIEFTGELYEVTHFGTERKMGVVVFGASFSGIYYLLNVVI